jgi:site-specific recombinase XerD
MWTPSSVMTLFKSAGVQGGHAHRFRDTFAVELLLAGVSLEKVAALLGNSVKIVEKHYAPWVAARQDQLEEAVRTSRVKRTKSRTAEKRSSKNQ